VSSKDENEHDNHSTIFIFIFYFGKRTIGNAIDDMTNRKTKTNQNERNKSTTDQKQT
jgi:hypothetical protein